MSEYKFKEKDSVAFNYGGVNGYGKIAGVATTELPVLGCFYIVNVLSSNQNLPNETYPFKSITVPEIGIVKINLAADAFHYENNLCKLVFIDGFKGRMLLKIAYMNAIRMMPEPEKTEHIDIWAKKLFNTPDLPGNVTPEHIHSFLVHACQQ